MVKSFIKYDTVAEKITQKTKNRITKKRMRPALPGGENAAGEETILQELGDGLILRSPKNFIFKMYRK
jgi:hypothetical protein